MKKVLLLAFLFNVLSFSAQEASDEGSMTNELLEIFQALGDQNLAVGKTTKSEVELLMDDRIDESTSSDYKVTSKSGSQQIEYKFYFADKVFSKAIIQFVIPKTPDFEELVDRIITLLGEPSFKEEYSDGALYYDWKFEGFHCYLSLLDPVAQPIRFRIDIK
jgi:hypothetical protein